MKKRLLISLIGLILMSCNARKDIVYMQDVKNNQAFPIENKDNMKLEYGDRLQVIISCREKELAALLNMPTISFQSASDKVTTQKAIHSYTVSENGTIQLPVIGDVKVQGLTTEQVQDVVANKITETGLIKDFTVTANFTDMKFYVVGEVKKPNKFAIENNRKITILQALALAGDLKIDGKRKDIFVIRQENGNRITYPIDLRSGSLFSSPAYYLKQNDVIYVEASRKRSNQSKVSYNLMEDAKFWVRVSNAIVKVSNFLMVIE